MSTIVSFILAAILFLTATIYFAVADDKRYNRLCANLCLCFTFACGAGALAAIAVGQGWGF